MRLLVAVIALFFSLTVMGCTQPGEATGVAAATGGAIGAGLGAIVGNQTGDPGAGMVLGALAGASTGGLIGNALEAQEQRIRANEEALERQEQLFRAQSKEVTELRRLDDGGIVSGDARGLGGRGMIVQQEVDSRHSATLGHSAALGHNVPTTPSGRFVGARSETAPDNSEVVRPTLVPQQPSASYDKPALDVYGYDASVSGKARLSPECINADEEFRRSAQVVEKADKLFHLRRALRMCPDVPEYHNALGELYISLERNDDAEFEFKEALKLNPSYSVAQQNLNQLQMRRGGER